ncbi:MAG: T9SS type A sorting domain-containing protein [Chitinophagales bacterium]
MKSIYSIILSFSVTLLFGQSIERQVVSPYGSYEESGALALSSTVGEVATATLEQADIILTQGFQQPSDIDDTVGIERVINDLNISAFPNPTTQKVILELNSNKEMEIFVRLFDINGKQLRHGNADQVTVLGHSVHEIDLSAYASGHYIIHLSEKEKGTAESIKVQKIE